MWKIDLEEITLPFLGVRDAANETWQYSQSKVLAFCGEKIKVFIPADAVASV